MICKPASGASNRSFHNVNCSHAIVAQSVNVTHQSSALFSTIFRAYFGAGNSERSFWHDQPSVNPNFTVGELGEYYMPFLEKADYAGALDEKGLPMLDYLGKIGREY